MGIHGINKQGGVENISFNFYFKRILPHYHLKHQYQNDLFFPFFASSYVILAADWHEVSTHVGSASLF